MKIWCYDVKLDFWDFWGFLVVLGFFGVSRCVNQREGEPGG